MNRHNGAHAATTTDRLEADIERQRADLADTVDALHARLDVKSRAKDRLTTDSGKPTPQAVAGGVALLAVVGSLVVLRLRRR